MKLPDVLEVRREVGQGAAAVHLLAGGAGSFGHGSRAAAEHADFADLQREREKGRNRLGNDRQRQLYYDE